MLIASRIYLNIWASQKVFMIKFGALQRSLGHG